MHARKYVYMEVCIIEWIIQGLLALPLQLETRANEQ
jgi:hypothetical protein